MGTIRNVEVSAVETIPPAEEKKRTMIVLIRGTVAPVGTFSLGRSETDRHRMAPIRIIEKLSIHASICIFQT